ncbi:MAG TPA: PLP-dependent aminotransferase family protein [Alphaproteobacteria bacterium]|nr:PLP-dependent aminotransferase family protein [Alphaproteobacteria bacterium]
MSARRTLLIPLDPTSTKPIYLQIADYITALARNGQLKAGNPLPASRTLAAQLQVHRSTVVNAYEELKARGIIESRQGSGSFIAEGLIDRSSTPPAAVRPIPAHPEALLAEIWRLSRLEGVVSLALGLPADELTPIEEFDRIRQRVLRRDGARAVGYEDPQGHYPLRHAIAADLARHGLLVEAEDIIITWGAQEGISLVARALATPGDCALTEVPAFFGSLFNLTHLGIHLLGFDLTPTGPEWQSLAEQLDTACSRPRFVYVGPDHQNPTGAQWSTAERLQFIRFLTARDVPIIEDATYRDLAFEGPSYPPLRALDPEVIYVGSFSKSLMPGLRIGFVVANGRLREHLITLKTITSGSGESLGQRALAVFLSTGQYATHLERVAAQYRQRRDAMLEALDTYFPSEVHYSRPAGGFYVWVTLPDAIPVQKVFRQALEHDLVLAPATVFYPDRSCPNAFRLAYSRYPEDILTRAVRTLGAALKSRLAPAR